MKRIQAFFPSALFAVDINYSYSQETYNFNDNDENW